MTSGAFVGGFIGMLLVGLFLVLTVATPNTEAGHRVFGWAVIFGLASCPGYFALTLLLAGRVFPFPEWFWPLAGMAANGAVYAGMGVLVSKGRSSGRRRPWLVALAIVATYLILLVGLLLSALLNPHWKLVAQLAVA